MRLRILNVAYPFAPVGADAVGGAEQILTCIAEALTTSNHESFVLACQGSKLNASLFELPRPDDIVDDQLRQKSKERVETAIEELVARLSIELVHFHGVDFFEYIPAFDLPMLATMHLPLSWYPEQVFNLSRVYLQCVSKSQRNSGPAALRPEIENGVPIERLRTILPRENFVLCLGRICPEKGLHHALAAAKRAGLPCILGGEVFPYESHIAYFTNSIVPLLSDDRRFVGPVGFLEKRRLLNSARCLLVPSLVAETSSLVAMESISCGTPVIAFRNGALPDIIDDGKTGFLVSNESEMVDAIHATAMIDPALCQKTAAERFDVNEMTSRYIALYRDLIENRATRRSGNFQEVRDAG
jgi:glycosyltransferase involved in cell wall biosynthesis